MNSKDEGSTQSPKMTSNTDAGNAAEPDNSDPNIAMGLDPHTQIVIGQRLKAVYGEIVRQPIPGDLLRLLDELAAKDRK